VASENVSFDLRRESITALIGPNGAAKELAWGGRPASASFPTGSGEVRLLAAARAQKVSCPLLVPRPRWPTCPASRVRTTAATQVAEIRGLAGIRPGFGSTGLEAKGPASGRSPGPGQNPLAATWPCPDQRLSGRQTQTGAARVLRGGPPPVWCSMRPRGPRSQIGRASFSMACMLYLRRSRAGLSCRYLMDLEMVAPDLRWRALLNRAFAAPEAPASRSAPSQAGAWPGFRFRTTSPRPPSS